MTVIETERLLVRTWDADDWRDFLRLTTNPLVMRYIHTSDTWSEERTREFVEQQIAFQQQLGFCMWKLARRPAGELIGMCGLKPLGSTPEIEIGWWLLPECWGQGLATEAAAAVLRYGFERAGLERIVSVAQPENAASVRVMEKIGMEHAGHTMHKGIAVVKYAAAAASARS